MNCCDEYGNCRQGRDCPIRAQLIEARLMKDDSQERFVSWISDAGLGWLIVLGTISVSSAGIGIAAWLYTKFA